jgi:hypothetical protein
MKLSEDVEKVTIPGRKRAYRLFGGDGQYTEAGLSLL